MRIETQEMLWECGDKCCSEYGTVLYIDGRQVEDCEFSNEAQALRYVLEEVLGHEVGELYEDE